MGHIYIGILVMIISVIVSAFCYPRVLDFARKHNIVDNPSARKLQRVPVPVMGGVVVFVGIVAAGIVLDILVYNHVLTVGLVLMTLMMLIGVWDDMRDISALLRLLIEFATMTTFVLLTNVYIDDFHGLWGVNEISPWIGIPLSVIAGVGIINAINMIDGVDGYLSGFGILVCICLGLVGCAVCSPVTACISMIVIGAILPFFFHNVFGVRSKMFFGDGGTLMLGTLMALMMCYMLSSKHRCHILEIKGVGLVAFTIAVFCIPIFDMLRVMTLRILRGRSPFRGDKTHLHHLFIDMGFSHLGAAISIIMINAMVVIIWYLSWIIGASVDTQLYIVIGLGMVVTFGFYKYMKVQQCSGPLDSDGYPQGTKVWHAMLQLGRFSHKEKKRLWRIIRYLMDGPILIRVRNIIIKKSPAQ